MLPALATSLPQSLLALFPAGPAGGAAFLLVWLLASAGVVWVFRRVIQRRARASATKLDDVVVDALSLPLYLWLVLGGLWAEVAWFDAVPASWAALLRAALPVLFIASAAYAVVQVVLGLMDDFAARKPAFRAVQGVFEFGARLTVYAVALMLALQELGVSITPLLGALGIGGLAVALALQDTLANFFAGMYLSLDRPLREGDYIEVDGGGFGSIKGHVVDVSWRSTRIRELGNNVFVIPNGKLASGIIKNYDLPETEMACLVQVSVAYESDLEQVERVTVDTARDVLRRVEGGVRAFEPFIRYHTFGDSGIAFTVILRVRTFVDQYLVTHEFVKALHAAYRKHGIVIPYPQRVLRIADGDARVTVPLHAARRPGEA